MLSDWDFKIIWRKAYEQPDLLKFMSMAGSVADWVCAVCLCLFGRQLVLEILEHLQ